MYPDVSWDLWSHEAERLNDNVTACVCISKCFQNILARQFGGTLTDPVNNKQHDWNLKTGPASVLQSLWFH